MAIPAGCRLPGSGLVGEVELSPAGDKDLPPVPKQRREATRAGFQHMREERETE